MVSRQIRKWTNWCQSNHAATEKKKKKAFSFPLGSYKFFPFSQFSFTAQTKRSLLRIFYMHLGFISLAFHSHLALLIYYKAQMRISIILSVCILSLSALNSSN